MYLKFSVKKAKQLRIMKIWIWWEIQKPQKLKKNPFLHDEFSTNLVHKSEFLNLGFCSIFFKFWHSVSFVKDYSVLVGRHTILQYSR